MPDPHGAPLNRLPLFEQPQARMTKFVRGGMANNVAHTQSPLWDRNKIFVDDPDSFDAPTEAHELFHNIQQKAQPLHDRILGLEPGIKRDANPSDPNYDYGGEDGLLSMRQHRGTIANLTDEQQASLPQNYMQRMDAFRSKASHGGLTQGDLKEADTMNQAYQPFLQQEANMAYTGPGINTVPPDPGPPPATLTGMIKPLAMMGGETVYAGKR